MESSPNTQTANSPLAKRCVNLDWLEVHAREPIEQPHTAEYFRGRGYVVRERGYGTRVYKEMFVIDGSDGNPLIEVRRNPASQGLTGIHDPNETHIRLVNRACYFDNAAVAFSQFLGQHRYTDIRISRIDICLDFELFDKGDNPQAFIRRYFRHKYAKVNQGRITGHGDDTWNGQEWNSVSWGSPTSSVSTKMYNKTLELYNPKTDSYEKPWIRQAWCICGLVDDWQRCTRNGEKVVIWRVEFSVKSPVKNWMRINLDGNEKEPQSIRNTLEMYSDRAKILVMFASLANHYFRFKKYKQGRRKDRCKDKVLFEFTQVQETYKVGRPDYAAGNEQTMREKYARLIAQLQLYQQSHPNADIYKACDLLISTMQEDDLKSDLACPWSREELEQMRLLLTLRTRNKEMSYEAAMTEVKKLLRINDRTIDTF